MERLHFDSTRRRQWDFISCWWVIPYELNLCTMAVRSFLLNATVSVEYFTLPDCWLKISKEWVKKHINSAPLLEWQHNRMPILHRKAIRCFFRESVQKQTQIMEMYQTVWEKGDSSQMGTILLIICISWFYWWSSVRYHWNGKQRSYDAPNIKFLHVFIHSHSMGLRKTDWCGQACIFLGDHSGESGFFVPNLLTFRTD